MAPASTRGPAIFDPFFTTRERGTGLGLAVVQAVVLEHGGSLRASTSTLGGARFDIQLPWIDAAQVPAITKEASLMKPSRILVVEDDSALAQALADTLSLSGYEVVTATDGEQALARLDRKPGRHGADRRADATDGRACAAAQSAHTLSRAAGVGDDRRTVPSSRPWRR